MLKYRKLIIFCLIVILLVVVFWDNIPFNNSSNGAEKAAITFVEYMLDGNAKKITELICDDLIDTAGYKTKKLFTNALDKTLDAIIDYYKDKYGKRWSYEVSVIDSFNVDVFNADDYTPEDYEEGTVIMVILEIKHKGGGLFKDKEGIDELELIMEYSNGKWLVFDFPF